MTADDLDEVESVLGVKLPAPYRGALLAYPLDPADPNSQIALIDDARAVIAFNRFLREEFAGDWLPGYFAFGNSPCGDPYFLALGGGTEDVWVFDHETQEVVPQSPSFDSWVAARQSGEAEAGRGGG